VGEYKKIVCLGDQHIPFIDKKAHLAVVNFLTKFKPDKIILLGDLIDLWQISSFDKSPHRDNCVYKDLQQAKQYLQEIRELAPEVIYLFGNHEDRMRKQVWKYVPEYRRILNLSELLGLGEMGIQFYTKKNDVHQEGVMLFAHGSVVRKHSAYTAKAMLDTKGMSIIHGHTHRGGSHYKTDCSGTFGAWENFCLCNPEEAKDWVGTYPPNWQQGFSVVFMKGKLFIVKQVYIHKGKFLFGEEEFSWK